jgi:hypothetical protein
MMSRGASTDAADPGINRVLAAAAGHSLPVNLLCWDASSSGRAVVVTGIARELSAFIWAINR